MKLPFFPGRGPNQSMTKADWDDILCLAMLAAFLFFGLLTSYSFSGGN